MSHTPIKEEKFRVYLDPRRLETDYAIQVNSGLIYDAMRYISINFGTNIYPKDPPVYKEEMARWEVKLYAILLNKIKVTDRRARMFKYRIDDVGTLVYDENHNRISEACSTADQINDTIYQKFWEFRDNLSSFLLQEKKDKWGLINRVHVFMNPLYAALTHLIIKKEVPNSVFQNFGEVGGRETTHWRYINLVSHLDNKTYVIIDEENTIMGPDLEQLIKEKDQPFEVVTHIVGETFAQKFSTLVNNFNLHLGNFLYLPRTYYSDALDYGENISMFIKELLKRYLHFKDRRYSDVQIWNLENVISELIFHDFLKQAETKPEESVYGEEKLWNGLIKNRDRMLGEVKMIEVET